MILDKIVEDKKKRLISQKEQCSLEEMKEKALQSERTSISFYQALAKPGLSIIGEFKKASPSMGVLNSQIDLEERIKHYNHSVDAISCLTEEDHFHGNIDFLKYIRSISSLPIIRKDFIIDEYQVYEAKVIGADAILLIAAILDDALMKRLYDLAKSLGLDILLEVHDEEEMKRAVALKADIIGVNNRNLKDFSIDLSTTKQLANLLPENTLYITESGITKDEDVNFLKTGKVDGFLIGRALMESPNPEELALHWKSIFSET